MLLEQSQPLQVSHQLVLRKERSSEPIRLHNCSHIMKGYMKNDDKLEWALFCSVLLGQFLYLKTFLFGMV